MKNMDYEFDRPNRSNVDIGDLVVLPSPHSVRDIEPWWVRVLPIIKKDDENEILHTPLGNTTYDFAVVLKKDGTYLVGKEASRWIKGLASIEKKI